MTPPTLDILVIADLHYAGSDAPSAAEGGRQTWLGPLLVRKALQRLRHEGVQPGLVILLGDLVNDGLAPQAESWLRAVADEAAQAKAPVLSVPGNHDADAGRFARVFNCPPGLHEIGGYGFIVFHDRVDAGDVTTRPPDGLALPAAVAAARPDLPLIALQHNPLHPRIEDAYPYMPSNTEDILASYRAARVVLSLSGHYHPGQALHRQDGPWFYTAPTACQAPFRFAHVRLAGREVAVREHALYVGVPGLTDVHCHTEYAYCGTTVNVAADLRVAQALGVHRLCLVEHSFQLYFPADEAWSWRWQTDDAMVQRSWGGERGRMPEYRRFIAGQRGERVRIGLEVDLRRDGSLLLAPEDEHGWDLLIGGIHAIPDLGNGATQADTERLFLRDTERLLAHPIQVLAHPFRFFRRSKLQTPQHLYRPVARMLAARGVAAEINYHTNATDARFIEECVACGVKVALGTDSHDLAEVGELAPHLAVLRQAGVRPEDFPTVLYAPP